MLYSRYSPGDNRWSDRHSAKPSCAEKNHTIPPTTRLPNELLHLLMWISDGWHLYSEVYSQYRGEPLDATRICSHWRWLSLSSPDLWAHMVLSPDSKPIKLETYISRSSKLPLYIKYFDVHSHKPAVFKFLYSSQAKNHAQLLAASSGELPSSPRVPHQQLNPTRCLATPKLSEKKSYAPSRPPHSA